jgi:hypothetical protein
MIYYIICGSTYGYTKNHSLITTKEGYIGLALMRAKAGDIISVLLGYCVPLVSRATEGGQYKVVEERYVCGLMHIEALLGRVRGHFEFVWHIHERFSAHLQAYIDRDIRETLVNDQRLGPLPESWRKKSHVKERAYSIFVKDGDSSIAVDKEHDAQGMCHDPRLTLETLAARDVNLTVFELV